MMASPTKRTGDGLAPSTIQIHRAIAWVKQYGYSNNVYIYDVKRILVRTETGSVSLFLLLLFIKKEQYPHRQENLINVRRKNIFREPRWSKFSIFSGSNPTPKMPQEH